MTNSQPEESSELTLKDIDVINKELEYLLTRIKQRRDPRYHWARRQIEEFIWMCQRTIDRGTALGRPNQPLGERSLEKIDRYIGKWTLALEQLSNTPTAVREPISLFDWLKHTISRPWRRTDVPDHDLADVRTIQRVRPETQVPVGLVLQARIRDYYKDDDLSGLGEE